MHYHAIAFTAREQAELTVLEETGTLAPHEVRGRTLYTLISPGTELASGYQGLRYQGTASYPTYPGYAAVFEVEEVGAEVQTHHPGDIVFCMGRHQSRQRLHARDTVAAPPGLIPLHVPLARLMGVSMTTLMTTAARPGDRVLVTGAGPVGYLGAQLFRHAGYEVYVIEPHAGRRAIAAQSGIAGVFASMPLNDPAMKDRVALVVECSGHEQAVLDACRIVRPKGEVVLVGVPWRRQTEITAHAVLAEVFHRYVVLRSGWEWEVPHHADAFRPYSIFGGYERALKWLSEGHIPVEGLIKVVSPTEAQQAYRDLLDLRDTGTLFTIFDWSQLSD